MSLSLHWSTFSTIRSTQPVSCDVSLETLRNILTTPRLVVSKKEIQNPFSMVRYRQGTKRGNEGLQSITGFVLDFDFKEDITTLKTGHDFIFQFLKDRGLLTFNHVWYTTFSYTTIRPNFRVVLPFHPSHELFPEEARRQIDKLFYWLNDSPYLDDCSRTLAQVYYPPVIRKGEEEKTFFCSSNIQGNYFDPNILEERPKHEDKFQPVTYQTASAEFFERALEYISPNIDYSSWIKVGMGLKVELGESGFYLWDRWSQGGSKYQQNKQGEMQKTWLSFRGSGVTGGTLIKMAKDRGFQPYQYKGLIGTLSRTYPANVVSFPHGAPLHFENPNSIGPSEFLEDLHIEDEHEVFKDWEDLDIPNIYTYDLSPWPLLDFLNHVFLKYAHPKRHINRLASVITLAGHVLRESFGCPEATNFYTLAMMPTGIGKNKFIEVIDALLEFFTCGAHIVRDIGTVQGLHKHLLAQNGKMFNLVDEASELIRNMNMRGNIHKDEVKKAFKEISTGNKLSTKLIKGETLETLDNIYASAFWTGTDECFRYLEEDDFRSGMMGRFLYFYTPDFTDFGVGNRQLHEMLRQKITDAHLQDCYTPLHYEFGPRINFSDPVFELSKQLRRLCQKKAEMLGKKDLRNSLLVRAQHSANKLATLTCDEQGLITEEGMRWAIGVVISSLRAGSFLTQERFHMNRSTEDVERIKDCVVKLCQKGQSPQIRERNLYRSLRTVSKKRIEFALERLCAEGWIERRLITNQPGSNSKVLLYKGFLPKIEQNPYSSRPQKKEDFEKLRTHIQTLCQKSQDHKITKRDLIRSFQSPPPSEHLENWLKQLQEQKWIQLEKHSQNNEHPKVLIHWVGPFSKSSHPSQEGEIS